MTGACLFSKNVVFLLHWSSLSGFYSGCMPLVVTPSVCQAISYKMLQRGMSESVSSHFHEGMVGIILLTAMPSSQQNNSPILQWAAWPIRGDCVPHENGRKLTLISLFMEDPHKNACARVVNA